MSECKLGYREGRAQAHVETEGFLHSILTTENLTSFERKAYNRILRYVRKQAGISHKDIETKERMHYERQTVS